MLNNYNLYRISMSFHPRRHYRTQKGFQNKEIRPNRHYLHYRLFWRFKKKIGYKKSHVFTTSLNYHLFLTK